MNCSMKRILLFLALVISGFYVHSQYTSGYIITKKDNDTIRGEINDKKTSVFMLYFKDSTGEESSYKPNKIHGFYRDSSDQYYIGYKNSDAVGFFPRIIEGYYNVYQISMKRTYYRTNQNYSCTVVDSENENKGNTWLSVQHEYKKPVDIYGVSWKKRLLL